MECRCVRFYLRLRIIQYVSVTHTEFYFHAFEEYCYGVDCAGFHANQFVSLIQPFISCGCLEPNFCLR
ncbi:hypothetical protein HDU98_009347 [Podochytrium sp. JEL0797]|nr:hypothetical protein HDU98_009347 [Podochytrium sp. JEL0797]